MFNPHVYFWLQKRAKDYQIKIPSNYADILLKYQQIEKPSTDKIIFSRFASNSEYISASAAIRNRIIFNAEWAARIVLFDNDETMNAFKATVGHELTHKEPELSVMDKSYCAHIFKMRVNEVHADFGAIPKMLNNSRDLAIKACKYKKLLKKSEVSKKLSGHPSWGQRLAYISDFDFNSELIYRIAKDMDFDNFAVINQAANFYKDIILN